MSTDEARIRSVPAIRVSPLTVLEPFVGLVVVWLGVNLVKEPLEFYGLFLIDARTGPSMGSSRSATRSSTASSS